MEYMQLEFSLLDKRVHHALWNYHWTVLAILVGVYIQDAGVEDPQLWRNQKFIERMYIKPLTVLKSQACVQSDVQHSD
ncbi:hypothetical protein D3C77_589090 [compost metagenome]